MQARTLRVRQVPNLLPTINHIIILVAGRGASGQAFPRGAWEREMFRERISRNYFRANTKSKIFPVPVNLGIVGC
jgi:hypothetical protein